MKLKSESKPSRCKPSGKKNENKKKNQTEFIKTTFNQHKNFPFRPMAYCKKRLLIARILIQENSYQQKN
ncbi:hypothetical protein [Pantoea septica]|uniref:hypothetical protein n=1 Tax=Pantoea septica TaxID=472695 RepID=UPI003D030765